MNSESTSETLLPVAENFKWTKTAKNIAFQSLLSLGATPFGINKYVSIMVIQDDLRKKLNIHVPHQFIWKFLTKYYNIENLDSIAHQNFKIEKKPYELRDEYKVFLPKGIEEIKETKDGVNDEINKIQLSSGPNKISSNLKRLKSMCSVNSKDDHNVAGPSSFKVSEVEFEEIPSIRRSLRTYDKPEQEKEQNDKANKPRINNKTDVKKVTDSKQPNKNFQNQSKDLEKNIPVSNAKNLKRKNRNVSESSFSSNNSKQHKYMKNNLTDLNISDSSSRSVTPEILRGKTSNQSVTAEIIGRKTNLRSSNKDQKSKLSLEKASTKLGITDINEILKTERLEKSVMDSKCKSLVQNKNELKQGKSKVRGRLTADLMVAQQLPIIQPLGRRSCSNNKSS